MHDGRGVDFLMGDANIYCDGDATINLDILGSSIMAKGLVVTVAVGTLGGVAGYASTLGGVDVNFGSCTRFSSANTLEMLVRARS